jgi:hypothetical protein
MTELRWCCGIDLRRIMISKPWCQRLLYVAMSVFVVWHVLAIVVAPAPDSSAMVQSLRRLLHPYLTLFRLGNKWNFYAPNVGKGHQFRYIVEDAAGTSRTFMPTDDLSWYHPTHWWFRAWYDAIVDSPDVHGDSAAARLCRQHAALHPVAVTLLSLEEKDFSPADHLGGKHPLDSDFVTVNVLKHVRCPAR